MALTPYTQIASADQTSPDDTPDVALITVKLNVRFPTLISSVT
jgi:hypothetical protein